MSSICQKTERSRIVHNHVRWKCGRIKLHAITLLVPIRQIAVEGRRRSVLVGKQLKSQISKEDEEEDEDERVENLPKRRGSGTTMDAPTSWDALRKQARKLEAQLDEQMVSYRKVVSTKVSAKNDTSENDLESGIDRLLKQLQQVNLQMQNWVSSGGSEMVSHTLTRHQEILQDLTQEFYRLRSSLRAKQEHASLLEDFREFDRTRFLEEALLKEHASVSRSTGQEFYRLRSSLRAKQEHASLLEDFREFDRTRLDLEEGVGSAEQALLKEHASVSRSTGQVDNVISQAQATLGALVFQRSSFGGINSKLSNVSSRLPMVNNVLSAIKRKKFKDTIVLSLVASVCIFLIFIYWLTK
ncbi:Golgi SNAP receptor complex member 1-1 [Morella rubra]|uniref:Golgi SNAP receptor complex member 1-1 n=1 Tax=Morella rubra TaxID=262757 RepID=A0A6A1W0K7_9ROSI|nr:Golgi SNAP receptor complex member 1-1 [Morella rubra]